MNDIQNGFRAVNLQGLLGNGTVSRYVHLESRVWKVRIGGQLEKLTEAGLYRILKVLVLHSNF